MGTFEKFVIRAVLSCFFALLISKFFFNSISVLKVAGLACVLLGLSYVLEYLKKRESSFD